MPSSACHVLRGGCLLRSSLLLWTFANTVNAQPVQILHSFGIEPAIPLSRLLRTSDGTLYGTAALGGPPSGGAIYSMKREADGSWKTSVLHVLNPETDGAFPAGGLIEGSDGALYGTTMFKGPSGANGTIYKVTTAGAFTTLFAFSQPYPFGSSPMTGLVEASDGNFYGTAQGGTSASAAGTIFRMTPEGVVTLVHEFDRADGISWMPMSPPIQGSDGDLYGTTFDNTSGVLPGNGTIYRLSLSGEFTTLHEFGPLQDGRNPFASLVQASDGALYGTTVTYPLGGGTAFRIMPDGTFTTLHVFTWQEESFPTGALIEGSDGNLYGTLSGGGALFGGAVFRMTRGGAVTILHRFGQDEDSGLHGNRPGAKPFFGLVEGDDGMLYGTTVFGGYAVGTGLEGSVTFAGAGTVFQIGTSGGLATLKIFDGDAGLVPLAPLTAASDGNLYGVTYAGGATPDIPGGRGTIFRMTTTGVVTPMYSFGYDEPLKDQDHDEGANPIAGLAQAGDGALYGTTRSTIFKVTLSGQFTLLHTLTTAEGAGGSVSSLLQGADGALYGTTSRGGSFGLGTIFRITTDGTFTSLQSFSGGNGTRPSGPLVRDATGALYGTTAAGGPLGGGTIFRLGATLTVVHSFQSLGGLAPVGGLVRASDGSFYGTTSAGGASGNGTVFRLSSTGSFQSLHSFGPAAGGSIPLGSLIQAGDGQLYGTTFSGGLFRVSTEGAFQALATLGDGLVAGLCEGSDGRLYGASVLHGAEGLGFIYSLTP